MAWAATWNMDEARKMRDAGMSWEKIGKHFGMKGNTVKRKLDPEWDAHCRRLAAGWESAKWANRAEKQGERAKPIGRRARTGIPQIRTSQYAEEGWRRHLENLARQPKDDRSLTALILGDPPSWRSALHAKQSEGA